jgi:hypothetical protein
VNSPVLLEVGVTIVKGASPNVLAGTEKFVIDGITLFTVNNAVVDAAKKLVVVACVAVMVDVPIPRIVIMLPATVATAVLELVYVKAPVLFDVGAVIAKAEFPINLVGIEKFVNTGVPLLVVKDAVIVLAK